VVQGAGVGGALTAGAVLADIVRVAGGHGAR
jgi:homoserine dehydrogenase